MIPVARLLFRGSDESDGLLIGALLTTGRRLFLPGHVYEIQECMGEFIIRDVGPSWVKGHSGGTGYCWGNSVDHLLHAGKVLFLSESEYGALRKQRKSED